MRERLLERIRKAEKGQAAPGRVPAADILHSVQRHLALLLNTQRGSTPIAPDYGIPDFFSLLGMGDVETLHEMERMLTEVVQKYEPRLKDVAVRVLDTDQRGLNLHLMLSATLVAENEQVSVNFNTVLDSGGRVRIE